MVPKPKFLATAVVTAASLLATGCGAASAPQTVPPAQPVATPVSSRQPSKSLKNVVITVAGKGLAYFPLVAADKEGFFNSYGLQPKFEVMASSTAVAALSKGDAQFGANVGVSQVPSADQKGLDLRIIYVATIQPQHYIVSKKGYTSFQDLSGRTVGVDTVGGTLDVYVKALAAKLHVSGIKEVPTGDPAARLAALENNIVDAGAVDLFGMVKATSAGFSIVTTIGDYLKVPLSAIATSGKEIRSDPTTVKGFIKASLKGEQYLKDHPQERSQLAASWTGLDPTQAKVALDRAMPTFSVDGREPMSGWADSVSMLHLAEPDVKVADAADLINRFTDFSLLDSVTPATGQGH